MIGIVRTGLTPLRAQITMSRINRGIRCISSGHGFQSKSGWRSIAAGVVVLTAATGVTWHLTQPSSTASLLESGIVHADASSATAASINNEANSINPPPHPSIPEKMESFVRTLQSDIVQAIEAVEGPLGARFQRDAWTRAEGGEGVSCVLEGGKHFERAGVNISIITSPAPDGMLRLMKSRTGKNYGEGPFDMFVAGISSVMHPNNPKAPTVHFNYRYFELRRKSDQQVVDWWFGGGSDLTPAYLYEEDAVHFHSVLKEKCDDQDPTFYPRFKRWCDKYFRNVHRGESRGIGGIFFDDLDEKDSLSLFSFVEACGKSFLDLYLPIIHKRIHSPFTEEEKRWQQLRRGRYVEFNLVHDRGTKFGLATPGVRIESVLMSLPRTARWEYNVIPEPGTPEAKLEQVLRTPREWV